MRKINENKLAKEASKIEGKKINISIAQIKEVQKCLLDLLATFSEEQILELIKRHG